MMIEVVQRMLMWCTMINVVLLIVSFLILSMARQWVYKMHSVWFPITESQFNVAIYCFMGFYKILIIVLNIVPWIALSIQHS
jgi:hypothetical protein